MQYARAVEGDASDQALKLQALLVELADVEYLVRTSRLSPGLMASARDSDRVSHCAA